MRDLDEAFAMQPVSSGGAEVFDEMDEIDLASELLAVSNEQELDEFALRLIRRAGQSLGSLIRSDTGRALGGVLRSVARKALPALGSTLGGALAGPTGRQAGARLASAGGRIFRLELEGLSPEDQEFEIARRVVRFGGGLVRNAGRMPRRANPRVAARVAALRTARRHAPGLLRRGGPPRASTPSTPSTPPTSEPPSPAVGRWVRQGRNVIVINCPQPGTAAVPPEPAASGDPAPAADGPSAQSSDSSAPDEGQS